MQSIDYVEYEYVEPLPSRYECTICTSLLQKPVQIAECGHRFCQKCFQGWQNRNVDEASCPMDRQRINNEKVFLDKAVEREIHDLVIRCTNNSRGCSWTGEIRAISDHCKFCLCELVPCENVGCQLTLQRKDLTCHLQEQCEYRICTCHFCQEEHIFRDEQIHLGNCLRYPLECENKCGLIDIERAKMSNHLKECPLRKLKCSFADMGCKFEGHKQLMDNHMASSVKDHLSYSVTEINLVSQNQQEEQKFFQQVYNNMEDRIKNLEDSLKDQAKVFEEQMRQYQRKMDENVRKLKLTIEDQKAEIQKLKLEQGSQIWIFDGIQQFFSKHSPALKTLDSDAFYLGKYRFQLTLYLYGENGKSNHISLFMSMLRGKFDNVLQWPLTRQIALSILAQDGGVNLKRAFVLPEDYGRQPQGKRNKSYGFPVFISHDAFKAGNFLKEDKVFIKMELY